MPGTIHDFYDQYENWFVDRLFDIARSDILDAFNSLNQKNQHEEKSDPKEFGIFLMTNERSRGNIYLSKDTKNRIVYTLIPHEGDIFENIPTSLIAPTDFTDPQAFEKLDLKRLKKQIINIATETGYIHSPDVTMNVYQANHQMRSVIQIFYHRFQEITNQIEPTVYDLNAPVERRQDCFAAGLRFRMGAISFFKTIKGNLQKWGFEKAMQMANETLNFTTEEHVNFHQDKLYDLLKNIPYGLPNQVSQKIYGGPAEITSQKAVLNAIKMLRPEQQIELLALCLDRRTVLGSHFWLFDTISRNGRQKANKLIRTEIRSLLEKLDPYSPALQLTNLRTTCVGFINPGPTYRQDWLKSSNSLDCARRVGLEIKEHPETVYLLEKREAIKAITTLSPQDQIILLKECLNPLTTLGNRFWEQEGDYKCMLTSGTLKIISDKLNELEKAFTPDRFGGYEL